MVIKVVPVWSILLGGVVEVVQKLVVGMVVAEVVVVVEMRFYEVEFGRGRTDTASFLH